MKKELKRKIRRLWRNRWLVGMAGLAALGLSILQAQTLLDHRPKHVDWVVEFSEDIDTFIDEESSLAERQQASDDIQSTAELFNLELTHEWLEAAHSISELRSTLNSARDLMLIPSSEIELVQILAEDVARQLDLEVSMMRDPDLARAWIRGREIELAHEFSFELAQQLDLSLNTLFIQIVEAELELQHDVELLQGAELAGYQQNEPLRSRQFFRSGVLLGCSLAALCIVFLSVSKLKAPLDIRRSAHLVAFLPEDYVAELEALNNRLLKQNISSFQRRFRLIEELILLFRVFYIQVPLDNLFLSSDDHSIDD